MGKVVELTVTRKYTTYTLFQHVNMGQILERNEEIRKKNQEIKVIRGAIKNRKVERYEKRGKIKEEGKK